MRYTIYLLIFALVVCSACSDDDDTGSVAQLPYNSDETVIISADGTATTNGCADLNSGCDGVTDECGANTRADVITNDAGEVVEIVCYPTDVAESQIQDTNDNFKPDESDVIVVLDDGSGNGLTLNGNVDIKGNNVIIYGAGEDRSIINGNLKLIGNNATIRGVRVTGDLTIESSGTEVLLSVVEGNLQIKASETTLSNTTVTGNVDVDQGPNELHGNRIAGNWNIKSTGDQCSGNLAFEDANGDKLASGDELGDALTCP